MYSTYEKHAKPRTNATQIAAIIKRHSSSNPAPNLTNNFAIVLSLGIGIIVIFFVTIFVAYQLCKGIRRKGYAEIMKDIKTESKDVELSTKLMKEQTAEDNTTFKFIVPKIRIYKPPTEDGEFILLPQSDEDDDHATSSDEG